MAEFGTYEYYIEKVQAIDAAIDAMISGGHQSYELDTGQGKQRVSRLDLDKLRKQRDYWIALANDTEGNGLMTLDAC